MIKSYAALADEATTVSVDQGLAAARELGKLTPKGDDEQKWAEAHVQLNRVVAIMRELPPEFQEMVLAKLEGRPGLAPTGGGAAGGDRGRRGQRGRRRVRPARRR